MAVALSELQVFEKMERLVSGIALLILVSIPSTRAQTAASRVKKESAQAGRDALQSSATFDQLVKRASEARESDRVQEAMALYHKALRIRPRWGEGWWYLGTLLYDQDQYAEARDAFRRLIPIQPKNAAVWAMLGLCEFRLRDYEGALADLQRARLLGLGANEELKTVSRYHAAILLTRFEQFEVGYDVLREYAQEKNATSSVIEAFGLNLLRLPFLPSEMPPEKRELVLMAGWAGYYMALRRPADARTQFQRLLGQYPQAPNLHYAYGVFLLLENPDGAIEQFHRELEISPSHIPARLQIAFEYIKRGDYKAGLPFAEEAVRLDPSSFPARNALGRILLETEDIARAVTELEEGVKLAPDSPEMRFALARAYTRAGRKEDAARERAAFLRLDKMQRELRQGAQSVGGSDPKPGGRRQD